RMTVRVAPVREHLCAAHHRAVRAHALFRPAAALAREPLAERAVEVEQVHVLERRRLVLDRVGGAARIRRARIAHLTGPGSWPTTRTARGRAPCAARCSSPPCPRRAGSRWRRRSG